MSDVLSEEAQSRESGRLTHFLSMFGLYLEGEAFSISVHMVIPTSEHSEHLHELLISRAWVD